ncbi:unnamed protein product, partial [Rotaria sp. Silwood1]
SQYNQQQQPSQYNQQQQPSQYNQQQQQPPSLPNQSTTITPQQRTIVQHLQQVRQQNHLNQQLESTNTAQLQQQQQQQQPSNSSTLPQSSSITNGGASSSTLTPTTSGGSSDEILQQLLTSPNPPKQPSNAVQNVAQARLRTINRTVRNSSLPTSQVLQQPPPSPMTPGADPMMIGNIPSPHSHPGMMMQQPQTPIGPPGQSPLARYMMAQSPQNSIYRPQMSPMNMMNYAGSPTAMIDDEMHYLYKFFTDRIHYLTRIITRCQQEGHHDKVAKYRQLHDQMAAFARNPMPEHLMAARRLKEHVDRILDPRMFGPVMIPPMVDMTGMVPPGGHNNGRLITNGIFEQCQRAIIDYLSKDTTLKYNVAKRFLEPLSEVLNGVPHKSMRLDTESKQIAESYSSSSNIHSSKSLANIIDNEFAHLSMNTFTYELKPMSDKMSTSLSSINDIKDLSICDYELTCRFIEINMPIVPPLKMKLTIQYPNEPPEVLSLTSTTLSFTPAKLEKSDGHSFFESISRNFIYFLFKLPTQHTVTDILDIWVRSSIIYNE